VYLKSLSLKGFKSFAERTTLEFEPGVAVVVGPNGSGKSNVVDAVAWALGAQGARSLRGGKMDDVIFAGTPKRPAAPKAEVSLTIDNSDGSLPIEGARVTITRSLSRDGESTYAINGDPCRLLDITELLSDTGVGRTQHIIVGQGRLDAILHASPADRRAVIEEAAGILKYRQRKEKAERRLGATAVNLERLTDLVKEVRRHLKPLERQADAARRYGGLDAELRALRLYLAGREMANLSERLEHLAERQQGLAGQEADARSRADELGRAVAVAEAALSALPADALGDALARAESIRARAQGLAALLGEKRRGVERSLLALADAGVVESLTAEAARLRAELARAEAAAEAQRPRTAEIDGAEAALAERRAGLETGDGRDARRAASAARAELAAVAGTAARTRAEAERLEGRREPVQRRLERLAEAATQVQVETLDDTPLVDALDAARAGRAEAERRLTEVEMELRSADAGVSAWTARAEALSAALGELRSQVTAGGILDGLDGIAGALVDLIEIEPGAEAAVAAGLGDALRAVVTDDEASGRAALERLRAAQQGGMVVVAAPDSKRGAKTPKGGDFAPEHLGSARPLAGCVGSSHPGLAAVLARLLAATVVVEGDRDGALALALAHPEAIVVTPEGDRFSGSAWRTGGPVAGATPGAVDEARRRAAEAAEARGAAETALAAARRALAEALRWEAAGDKALDSHRARQAALVAERARIDREQAEAEAEGVALEHHAQELAAQAEAEADRRAELEAALPELETAERSELAEEDARRAARRALEEEAAQLASARREHDRAGAALEERRFGVERNLAELEGRLARHGEARAEAEERRAALERRGAGYAALEAVVADRLGVASELVTRLRDRRRERSEAARVAAAELDARRAERAAAEREAAEHRERRAGVEVEAAEVRTRLDAAVETLRRDLECEAEVALAAPAPTLPDGATAAARAREIERELRQMGPINPLAVEEHSALCERHELLVSQLEDVKSARRDLGEIIRSVDEEIVTMFSAAFADTEEHFSDLIGTLFPGGSGRLRLTEPEDMLHTGIEIEARPSGKSVRRLSLLSGGERSLTALAFLFAVFRARPSPFYLLDEVEAALDDVNLCRFVDLVTAFRREAQLLVVSHQKRTMEAADCLYGVSMPPGGSSIVVTQRVPAAISVA
jgi:chromosome segregation protein